jgi:hypothetical protein
MLIRRVVRPCRFLRCVIRKKESRNLSLTSKPCLSYSVACQLLGMRICYLSAQTAFYSLNPDRDIPGPLAINPAYIRLAANHITAQGVGYRASEGKWCGFIWHAPPILYKSTLLLLTQYFYPLNISKSNAI